MQCYLSGHSDGSVESVEPTSSTATEDASSCGGGGGGTPRDRDSGLGPEADPPIRGEHSPPPATAAASPLAAAVPAVPRTVCTDADP